MNQNSIPKAVPIDYLRISVTDRCNLRCLYCMPAEGVPHRPHSSILSYEEITEIVKTAARKGIRRLRLTGGEPLIRPGLEALIGNLKRIPGIEEIAMTTNGLLLPEKALQLKEAGLDRVNISLDSLDPCRYRRITRRGDLQKALAGIDAAEKAGLTPLKINLVAIRGFNDDELADFAAMALDTPRHIRFIEFMPVHGDAFDRNSFLPVKEIRKRIEERTGPLEPAALHGHGPAVYFRPPGGRGTLGFISAISHPFCSRCNRLRLTADGKLRPCLLANREWDLKQALRSGGRELATLWDQAIRLKPGRHNLDEAHLQDERFNKERFMNEIGG